MPNLYTLVEDILGTPYASLTCWDLVRHLIREGCGLDLAAETQSAAAHVQELWYRGDPRDPLSLVQPWDLLILACDATVPVSDHVGLVLDEVTFVHARNAPSGVSVERLQRWRPKFLQLARLRRFL